mgnify:CR=1 FL=1
MAIKNFEEIISWQKSKALTVAVYRNFKNCKDYGFRDQIQRASVSIMNNIAEGFERQSHKDFIKFLYIAKGSCGEVRSLLNLAQELDYINKEERDILSKQSIEVSKLISGLIKAL